VHDPGPVFTKLLSIFLRNFLPEGYFVLKVECVFTKLLRENSGKKNLRVRFFLRNFLNWLL
jgi:hypothetical protein